MTPRRVFYTADVYGTDLDRGWISPDWSVWAVSESRDDVEPDVYDPDDDVSPARWLAGVLTQRLGACADGNGWWTAEDEHEDALTGATSLVSAHPEGFTPLELRAASDLISNLMGARR